MKKHSPQHQDIIEKVAAHVVQFGLSDTGIRTWAKAAGISDRMLIYHVQSKAQLFEACLLFLANKLAKELEASLGASTTLPAASLIKTLCEQMHAPDKLAVARLFFELILMGTHADEPGALAEHQIAKQLSQTIVQTYLDWVSKRLKPSAGESAQTQAFQVLAAVEGHLLLSLAGLNASKSKPKAKRQG